MRCEIFERLQRIANAMQGHRGNTGVFIHDISFEEAAQLWLLGARPQKNMPIDGCTAHGRDRVYFDMAISIEGVHFNLFTFDRAALPYEMPAPVKAPEPVRVVAVLAVEEDDGPSRTSLLEVN